MTEVLEYPNAPPLQLEPLQAPMLAPLPLPLPVVPAVEDKHEVYMAMEDKVDDLYHTIVHTEDMTQSKPEQSPEVEPVCQLENLHQEIQIQPTSPPTTTECTDTTTTKDMVSPSPTETESNNSDVNLVAVNEVKVECPENTPAPFEGQLERNCVIPVTVDDLKDGIIMVSFLHNNATYQGVLLQLNRERGIPCGISFPKDFCPGVGTTGDTDPNDPNQVSPLNQRNTYFQQTDADGGAGVGPKSRVALRRVIKPPARYKNARNHLKLRTRPVLCVKCRVLCEEKNAAENNGNENSNESTDKKASATQNIVGGVTTRRGYAKFISSGNFSGENSNEATEDPPKPKEEDFSFKSIGSKGIVENYWKRPLNEAKTDRAPTAAAAGPTLTNLIVNIPKINGSKAGRTMPELKQMTSGTSAGSAAGTAASKNPILLKSLTAPLKHSLPSAPHANGNNVKNDSSASANQESKVKPKSLGDCINNLTARKTKDLEKNVVVNRRKLHKSRLVRNVSQSSGSDNESNESHGSSTLTGNTTVSGPPKLQVQAKTDLEESKSNPPNRRRSSAKSDERNGSRKRSSTIPERYRDEAYLHKTNLFGFKKRRIEDENENTTATTTRTTGNEMVAVQFNDELPMSLVGCLEKRHPTTAHHLVATSTAKTTAHHLVATSTAKTTAHHLVATSTAKITASTSAKLSPPKEVKEGATKKQVEGKLSGKERSESGPASLTLPSSSTTIAALTGTSSLKGSTTTTSSICSNAVAGSSSSSSATNSTANINVEPIQQEVHSNKTPVIKITFGSPGNGVVVQIPPKETQNPAPSAPSIIPPRPEESTTSNSKAARKAMKRAKKAAKKSRSISFESTLASSSRISASPSSSAILFDNHSSTPVYAVTSTSVPTSNNRLQHSPSPPLLNPEYPFLSLDYNSSSESSNVNNEHHLLPLPAEFPTPASYIAKKRKKDKRKKKSKTSSSGKQVAKASSSTSVPKSESSDNNCTSSSSGSHVSIMSLCEDSKLRRLYHPEEGPLTTDDDTDIDSSAPVLKNEMLESLKYESENSATSASTENDHQERLCISLKRLSSNSNAYVTCSKSTTSEVGSRNTNGASTSAAADSSDNAVAGPSSSIRNSSHTYKSNSKKVHQKNQNQKSKTNNVDGTESASSDTNSTAEMNNNNFSTASETSDNELPMHHAGSPAYDENFGGSANSIDSYTVDNPPCTFRKGDIIWGKLSGCPWWPAKIIDILYITEDDIRAKVYWFNASTQSFIGFAMIVPFGKNFEAKFNRARRRGSYKKAVRQALIEAHRINPEDLTSD